MDLICYTYSGWDPRIRPASPKREWMERSPERFAYRCLPLSIANGHGWEILSPCGFEARWNGAAGVEGVEISLDPDTEPRRAPVSLFGQATITFHIEGIFRTPAGWNLWVGGSPNQAKDGIAPLGGVIETDWSPYTFTMNWQFTRSNHWVRFEKHEPICFFFPVQRGLLESIEPRIVAIDDAPDLKAEFEAWSRSRDAFHQWVRETNPVAPADRWQKLYYRGLRPGDLPGAADHQVKVRASPFAGAVPLPSECPVTARTEAARGAGTMQMPRQDQGDSSPRPNAAGTQVALDRRDWILSVMESQQHLAPAANEVPRVRGIDSQEFLARFYAPGRPVILQGELDEWPALRLWTPDYLKQKLGPAEIQFQGARHSSGDFELYKDRHKSRMPFDAFVDLIAGRPGNDAYLTAYNSADNRAALAPLDEDVRPLGKFLTGVPGMIWIGPMGTFTPLHFDLTNNLLAQVRGSKRVILVPPSETRYLYHHRHVFSAVHDIADEELIARDFPLAASAFTYELDLDPGELLYIPIGWWHQVTALDFSITYTFTDFLWRNNFHETFPPDGPG
jgi:hypothetical protein